MNVDFDLQAITLTIAEKLREIATRQGHVPFLSGDLRKSHRVSAYGRHGAILSADTPYARAVHDGRPAIIIRPRSERRPKRVTVTRVSRRTGQPYTYTTTVHPALYWRGAAHPVKEVRQPARRGRPWLTQSINTLQVEGLRFLASRISGPAIEALERDIRRSRFLRVRS